MEAAVRRSIEATQDKRFINSQLRKQSLLFLEEVADAFGNLIHVRNGIGGGAFEHVGGAFAKVADLFGDGFKSALNKFTKDFFG